MREWAKANGGPVGVVVLGLLVALPNAWVGGAVALFGVLWWIFSRDRVQRWLPFEWRGFGSPTRRGLDASYIADREIRLADLFSTDQAVITGKTFERCIFTGPGVVGFIESRIVSPAFDVGGLTPDALLWEVEEERWVVGGVAFQDCVLRDCKFRGCGIAGTKDFLDQARQEMKENRR
ncbi:MAG TPA: hypothetical protein VIE64_06465 [Solirubrobacterales bacterium]|jgi:hypothetical protein